MHDGDGSITNVIYEFKPKKKTIPLVLLVACIVLASLVCGTALVSIFTKSNILNTILLFSVYLVTMLTVYANYTVCSGACVYNDEFNRVIYDEVTLFGLTHTVIQEVYLVEKHSNCVTITGKFLRPYKTTGKNLTKISILCNEMSEVTDLCRYLRENYEI